MGDLGDIAGATISGGLSLAGGFLSNQANAANVDKQLAFQRESQQHGIQWRVNDAIAAGIHPLYALGASTTPSFPIALEDKVGPALAEAGQHIGGAVTRMMDTAGRERHQMDMALGAAQLEESDARRQMYLSEASRNRQQPGAPMPGLGTMKEGRVTGNVEAIDGQDQTVPGTGLIEVKPQEQLSSKEGNSDVVAGEHPGYEERVFRGIPMIFPQTAGESPEEILSEMSMPAYLGLLQLNQKTYGGNWLSDFLNLRYHGTKPENYYHPLKDQHDSKVKPYNPGTKYNLYEYLRK